MYELSPPSIIPLIYFSPHIAYGMKDAEVYSIYIHHSKFPYSNPQEPLCYFYYLNRYLSQSTLAKVSCEFRY